MSAKKKLLGWMARYQRESITLLNTFLLGTHDRVGADSPIRTLPKEILELIFSNFLITNFCHDADCGEEAVYACANRPGARAMYVTASTIPDLLIFVSYINGCFYLSCGLHSHCYHSSYACTNTFDRRCDGCDHHCDDNYLYCGRIAEFGLGTPLTDQEKAQLTLPEEP